MLWQLLKVDVFDEDLHPGTTSDDDDLLGRVDVELEGELTINRPIRQWFTLQDLGMERSMPYNFSLRDEMSHRTEFRFLQGWAGGPFAMTT